MVMVDDVELVDVVVVGTMDAAAMVDDFYFRIGIVHCFLFFSKITKPDQRNHGGPRRN
jgi:hypothetical protein